MINNYINLLLFNLFFITINTVYVVNKLMKNRAVG
jgi:hypothetical protein